MKQEIVLRRTKERKWLNDPTEYNFNSFYIQCRHVANITKSAQREYYIEKITENRTDYKAIFNIANALLFRKEPSLLPSSDSREQLANSFGQFFQDKIEIIMSNLRALPEGTDDHMHIEHDFETDKRFHKFTTIPHSDITKLIKSTPPKCCESDPLPTTLLKKINATVAPEITCIINHSLEEGHVSQNLKDALLKPGIKKLDLDKEILKNFRPISNLSYLSKLLERIVCNQLVNYTTQTGKIEEMQSAYCANHSTGTSLLKVKTDILHLIDKQNVVCVCMLDLSAAFDTISHSQLLNHLHYRFGIVGTALKWIESYLQNRTQSVVLPDEKGGSTKSGKYPLNQGILQGSVLGPILFNLYVSPLGQLCKSHGVEYQSYADDTQNYLGFKVNKIAIHEGVNCLENCLHDIKNWMWVNLLKLNDDKTEVIVLGTRQQLAKLGPLTLKVGDTEVTCIPCVRNLGVNFDAELKHTNHVNKLVSSSFHHVKKHLMSKTSFWTSQLPKPWSRHWSSVRLTTVTAYF